MTDALSTHYAHALADAVFGRQAEGLTPEEALRQLDSAVSLISGSKDLQRAFLSPAISRDQKKRTASRLADEFGVHRLIRNFLMVIVSHRRTQELPAIQQSFELLVDEKLGFVRAEISSATELDAIQREAIERALGIKIGKFIRPQYKVDPSLLGGVLARVDSKEYDGTVRGRLESLRQRLVGHV